MDAQRKVESGFRLWVQGIEESIINIHNHYGSALREIAAERDEAKAEVLRLRQLVRDLAQEAESGGDGR